MNRTSLLGAIVGASVLLLAAAPASAVYHPTLGRFLQRDPIGYADGMSLYEYVGGDPIGFVDPSGFALDDPKGLWDALSGGRTPEESRRDYERRQAEQAGMTVIADAAREGLKGIQDAAKAAWEVMLRRACDAGLAQFKTMGYTWSKDCPPSAVEAGLYKGVTYTFCAEGAKRVGAGGAAGVEVLLLCAPCKICCYGFIRGKLLIGLKGGAVSGDVGLTAGLGVDKPERYTGVFVGAGVSCGIGPDHVGFGVQTGGEEGHAVAGVGGSLGLGKKLKPKTKKGGKAGAAAEGSLSHYWLITCKDAQDSSSGWSWK